MGTAVHQRLAADPTSVALLLADPATTALWPGLEPVRAELDHDAVHVRLRGQDAKLEVTAPTRTATGYVLRFALQAPDRTTTGTLRLLPDGERSVAELALEGPADLLDDAHAFLARLAGVAAARSRAA